MIKIKKYKKIDLKYNESDGMIYFDFEGEERSVKYTFEAERIIDEPVWEDCYVEGYYVDGYIDYHIGLAKAVRKNIKNKEYDWNYKGKYDIDYKKDYNLRDKKVFIKNKDNEIIYKEWQKQKDIYNENLLKLNIITKKLK